LAAGQSRRASIDSTLSVPSLSFPRVSATRGRGRVWEVEGYGDVEGCEGCEGCEVYEVCEVCDEVCDEVYEGCGGGVTRPKLHGPPVMSHSTEREHILLRENTFYKHTHRAELARAAGDVAGSIAAHFPKFSQVKALESNLTLI